MRQARDRQRESLALNDSNPGKSVANIFRHRSSSKRGHELSPLLNDNKVFLINDTDKAELCSTFFEKHLNTESEPVPFFRSLSDRTLTGLDTEMELEPHFPAKATTDSHQPSTNGPYKCRILQHFPENCRGFPFSKEATAMLVMPNGLHFFTQAHPLMRQARPPFRHSFVITREDGRRVYGFALLFPEEVTHPGVKAALKLLETSRVFRDKTAPLSSPAPQNLRTGIQPDSAQAVTASTFRLSSYDQIFSMKAIGVLSRWPFAHGLFGWLEDLWSLIFFRPPHLPQDITFESFVYNILFEASLGSQGQCLVVQGPNVQHYCFQPGKVHVL
ncbi:DENN domain-containing protein 5B [Sparganum proliferum]